MIQVQEGQCGLCVHFGEHHQTPQLIQIRRTREAPPTLTDECGHPRHAPLNLQVTPVAGCDGFQLAAA